MKVESDLFNILKKGSLHGYFREPHRTVCSRTCGTPVLSMGVVRNCTLRAEKSHDRVCELTPFNSLRRCHHLGYWNSSL